MLKSFNFTQLEEMASLFKMVDINKNNVFNKIILNKS